MWHLFVVQCPRRDELQEFLAKRGVQTIIHYPIAPHEQIAYKKAMLGQYPKTEKIHREILSLPISPVMDQNEVEAVIKL